MLRSILLASLMPLGLGSVAVAAPRVHVPMPLLADGTTATDIVLSVPGFRPGDVVKVRSSTAHVDAVRVVAPGVVTARVMPDASAAPGTVQLEIRGKGADGKIAESVAVATRGGLSASITPLTPPEGATPGGEPAMLTLKLPPTIQASDTRQLLGAASIGSLGAPEQTSGSTWQVAWTPPAAAQGSQVAVLTFSDAAAPGRVVGVVAMPLRAEASITLDAPADSQNTLTHSGETLGPATASPAGTVAFTVAVDPRSPGATLESTARDGQVRTQSIELETADATLLGFLPGLDRRVADPTSPTPLLVAQLDARGRPVTDRPPAMSASRGSVGVARATGVPGIWLAAFTPPDTPGSVTFTAESGGTTIEHRATLVAPSPNLALSPSASPLAHDARSLSVTVSGGTGAPALEARGGQLGSRPRKTPDGTTFVVTPGGDAGGLWLLATPARGERGVHPARATVSAPEASPETGPLPYTVRLTDAAGLPVPDAALTVSAGWAKDIDAPDATDAQGLARVWLTPPTSGAETLGVRVGGVPGGVVLGPSVSSPAPSPHAPTTWVPREPPPVAVALATRTDPDPDAAPVRSPAPTEPTRDDTPGAQAQTSAAAPTPAGPPPLSNGTPWLRFGLSGGMGGHAWTQDADDGVAGPEDESDSAGGLPLGLGVAAVGIHAQAWFNGGPFGVDLDLVGQGGRFNGTDARTLRGGLGLQGRLGLADAVSLYAHLGAGTTPGFVVVYEDGDPEDETGMMQRHLGAQVGAGLLIDTPLAHIDLGVRELWAPWPVQTMARLDVGVAVADNISIDLRTGHGVRTMAYDVDGEDIDTEDSLTYVGLGVSFLAR